MRYPVKQLKLRELAKLINNGKDVVKNRVEMEKFVGQECLFCGDLMVRDISLALVEETDLLL